METGNTTKSNRKLRSLCVCVRVYGKRNPNYVSCPPEKPQQLASAFHPKLHECAARSKKRDLRVCIFDKGLTNITLLNQPHIMA